MLRGWRVQVLRLPWRPKGSFWPGIQEEQSKLLLARRVPFLERDAIRRILTCENKIIRRERQRERERGMNRCSYQLWFVGLTLGVIKRRFPHTCWCFSFFSCSGHVQVLDAMWLLGERIGMQTGKTAGGHNGENMCRLFGWSIFLQCGVYCSATRITKAAVQQLASSLCCLNNLEQPDFNQIWSTWTAASSGPAQTDLEYLGVWHFQARGDPVGSAAAPLPAATMGEVPQLQLDQMNAGSSPVHLDHI